MCEAEKRLVEDSQSETRSETSASDLSDEHTRIAKFITVNETSYKIHVSLSFIIVTFILSSALAFVAGQAGRAYLMPPEANSSSQVSSTDMPKIMLPAGKVYPDSLYSAKKYSSDLPVTSVDKLVEGILRKPAVECVVDAEGHQVCNELAPPAKKAGEEDIHHPKGQHLLIDIKNVSPIFLQSEDQLAAAMIELISNSGLTLLSYHCSRLEAEGVSCVGVLLESHVAFHTKPKHGTISIDLFTCGEGKLIPLLPLITGLFAVPIDDKADTPQPFVKWNHKKRGFPLPGYEVNHDSLCMWEDLLGSKRYEKKPVVTVQTEFQTIDIFDVHDLHRVDPQKIEDAVTRKGSYESEHPELYQPDRIIYLDGVMQSRRYGEAAYHEALVHPIMFAHNNPKRVAIIGGGEGATLREVLKHDTVEEVVMIEIDSEMISTSRKYLPEWNDCSNIKGSDGNCFDDKRTTVINTDAVKWFVDNEDEIEETFDVVIMDALDPSSMPSIAFDLYDSEEYLGAVFNSLTEDGVLVIQVGDADEQGDLPVDLDITDVEENLLLQLEAASFTTVYEYSDFHSRFGEPWSFFAVFKSEEGVKRWKMSQAEIDLEATRRLRRMKDGNAPLLYFDGATMMEYQKPGRISTDVYCQRSPAPESCTNESIQSKAMHDPARDRRPNDEDVIGKLQKMRKLIS